MAEVESLQREKKELEEKLEKKDEELEIAG